MASVDNGTLAGGAWLTQARPYPDFSGAEVSRQAWEGAGGSPRRPGGRLPWGQLLCLRPRSVVADPPTPTLSGRLARTPSPKASVGTTGEATPTCARPWPLWPPWPPWPQACSWKQPTDARPGHPTPFLLLPTCGQCRPGQPTPVCGPGSSCHGAKGASQPQQAAVCPC